MTAAQLQQQALNSAAHLVAALVDRRFGAGRLTDELKDCIDILRLGLFAEYRRKDGTLAAWHQITDADSQEIRRGLGRDREAAEGPVEYRISFRRV